MAEFLSEFIFKPLLEGLSLVVGTAVVVILSFGYVWPGNFDAKNGSLKAMVRRSEGFIYLDPKIVMLVGILVILGVVGISWWALK